MTVLLELEPRVAGSETLEPAADFAAEKWLSLEDPELCAITGVWPGTFCGVHGH
jgi:hypothetical protein